MSPKASVTALITSIAECAIVARVFPGCVVGIVDRNGHRLVLPYGRLTYEPEAPAVREGTVYDVASVTKSIPTAAVALRALEEGHAGLDTLLIEYVPEYVASQRGSVTLWHLLTHTLEHGPRLSALKNLAPPDLRAAILSADLLSPPGSGFFYANATSILLGLMVERLYGEPIDVLARRMFFGPLGMAASTFCPDPAGQAMIAPTEVDAWRGGEVRGVVHDESAWVLSQIMTPGSAGLFSTGGDLLTFLEMMLAGGALRGARCFAPDTIMRVSQNQVASLGATAGLGWELCQRSYMGDTCSARTIGKTGFTGCAVMCDLEKGIGLVLLSNRTWPRRREDRSAINRVRREMASAVFALEGRPG